jgi:hypothetical protein
MLVRPTDYRTLRTTSYRGHSKGSRMLLKNGQTTQPAIVKHK